MNSKILSYVLAVCASTAVQANEANRTDSKTAAETSSVIETQEEQRKSGVIQAQDETRKK